mgnify:FL=1
MKETGSVSAVAKRHGLPINTLYTWVGTKGGKQNKSAKSELLKLQKELAKKEIENQILRELLKKTSQAWLSE